MKFDKNHLSMLAGLIEDDDFEDLRHQLAEGFVTERQEEDLKVISDNVTLLEYLGFDPDPYEKGELDSEHPEAPEQPVGYEYYNNETPGYKNNPDDSPRDKMDKIKKTQEQNHWKNQLAVRGPGGQANELYDRMRGLINSCALNESCDELDEMCDEDEYSECSEDCSDEDPKPASVYEESLRDRVLSQWSINESADETVTMGFSGMGFGGGERPNKKYSGFGSSHDSGQGYTIWDEQIENSCPKTDRGEAYDVVAIDMTGETQAGEQIPPEEINRISGKKITGFEDDPIFPKTFGMHSVMNAGVVEPENQDDTEDMELMRVIGDAITKSRLGEGLDMMAMTYEELHALLQDLMNEPLKHYEIPAERKNTISKIKRELEDRKSAYKAGGLRGAR